MKDWVTTMTQELVQTSQHAQRAHFSKQLNQVKDLFLVPEVIGPHEQWHQSQGLDPCPFPDYKTFVSEMYRNQVDTRDFRTKTGKIIQDLNALLEEVKAEIRQKVNQSDHEKAEKKLLDKMSDRLLEIKDQARMDRSDFTNKLAGMKVDLSLATFDKDTHAFLKDRVYPEWIPHTATIREIETRFEESMLTQQRITKKLNESLAQLKLGSVSHLTTENDEEPAKKMHTTVPEEEGSHAGS